MEKCKTAETKPAARDRILENLRAVATIKFDDSLRGQPGGKCARQDATCARTNDQVEGSTDIEIARLLRPIVVELAAQVLQELRSIEAAHSTAIQRQDAKRPMCRGWACFERHLVTDEVAGRGGPTRRWAADASLASKHMIVIRDRDYPQLVCHMHGTH